MPSESRTASLLFVAFSAACEFSYLGESGSQSLTRFVIAVLCRGPLHRALISLVIYGTVDAGTSQAYDLGTDCVRSQLPAIN